MEILLHRIANDPYTTADREYSSTIDFGTFELDTGYRSVLLKTPGESNFRKSFSTDDYDLLFAKLFERIKKDQDATANAKLEKWITDNAI